MRSVGNRHETPRPDIKLYRFKLNKFLSEYFIALNTVDFVRLDIYKVQKYAGVCLYLGCHGDEVNRQVGVRTAAGQ